MLRGLKLQRQLSRCVERLGAAAAAVLVRHMDTWTLFAGEEAVARRRSRDSQVLGGQTAEGRSLKRRWRHSTTNQSAAVALSQRLEVRTRAVELSF